MAKKRRHDAAPNVEWVLMYRKGLTGQRIAGLVGRPVNTVAYHLRIARAADLTLERDHTTAWITAPAGAETIIIEALINYVKETSTIPSRKDPDPAVRRLGTWLYNRRRESQQGVLRDEHRERLEVLPGWDGPAGKKTKEDQQWAAKLDALAAYLQAGNDWPRNGTGETDEECALGRWIGTQRNLRHTGRLLPDRAKALDEAVPGWVGGRKGKDKHP